MATRYELLRHLADGRYHSGEDLGASLGVSRTAVWKALRGLNELGLDVHAVPGRGYRLVVPLELLSAERIREAMSPRARLLLQGPEIHYELGSTNRHLLRRARQGAASGLVCLAERQHEGRGRRGRSWVSPFGGNLYLSVLWRFPGGPASLAGLSLAAAVAVLRALKAEGVTGVGLKWPNDLVWQGAKLAGILMEVGGESTGPCHVVTGIGVNMRMPRNVAVAIQQPWVDLHAIAGERPLARNRLVGSLLNEILVLFDEYGPTGLAAYLEEWQHHDAFAGRPANVDTGDEVVSGTVMGVDEVGALLLDCDGRTRRFAHGDVSLRSG